MDPKHRAVVSAQSDARADRYGHSSTLPVTILDLVDCYIPALTRSHKAPIEYTLSDATLSADTAFSLAKERGQCGVNAQAA